MEKRLVREVKISRPIRRNVDLKEITLIDEQDLRELIKKIIQKYSNVNKVIQMTKKSFKDVIYDLVIKELRNKSYYYKNLCLNVIWKQVNRLSHEYSFMDTVENDCNLEEELDDLCWKKANNQNYNEVRLREIQKELGITN